MEGGQKTQKRREGRRAKEWKEEAGLEGSGEGGKSK